MITDTFTGLLAGGYRSCLWRGLIHQQEAADARNRAMHLQVSVMEECCSLGMHKNPTSESETAVQFSLPFPMKALIVIFGKSSLTVLEAQPTGLIDRRLSSPVAERLTKRR
jgi:hypothetical protein